MGIRVVAMQTVRLNNEFNISTKIWSSLMTNTINNMKNTKCEHFQLNRYNIKSKRIYVYGVV